jgi:hypothetical protein
MATDASGRRQDQSNNLGIKRRPSQALTPHSGHLQSCKRAFLYQSPSKFGHSHEHPELELADRILLGRIDPLTRAEQGHVPNLQFPDDDGEVG